ncbi:MAG: hypothetical protein N4A35_10665 [Flavobacteriales bacterium]|jgi:hypothetical protein|nr:hypothetical protein [Flavobacteriales bacterium]
MDFELEKEWRAVVNKASENFDEELDLQAILFVLGLQELNKGYVDLTKDQKLEVMHIAICTLLEPYGYYEFKGRDQDGWPHFERKESIPLLNEQEQEKFLKEAIIDYFKRTAIQ